MTEGDTVSVREILRRMRDAEDRPVPDAVLDSVLGIEESGVSARNRSRIIQQLETVIADEVNGQGGGHRAQGT